ncbi:DNA-3-methyladenine glycosylase [Alteromonas sp. CI.11.F.A3]|uniref:DNA-3-methyladenine glycosylase n=1 Tax=Alteromonas sp. CI.11.F.A3 TaxID=3079555 RepID=UPI002942A4B3|nr:DNA-3-methyladenine glycosylase [Alteromonas sp. CI.11.F.A3]WOI38547.1 DNA-3-methyladenine glycosylase [Alteromonas sp. CI.11.F.A3]
MMPSSFFTQSNVVSIAKNLLGKYLYSEMNGVRTGGIITETEAYSHSNDLAMQKHLLRRPSSVKTLKRNGGIAYIYNVYGYHSMFNIVTNGESFADSVLIRAIEPTQGLDTMLSRRNMKSANKNLCSGPAKLTQALALTPSLNATSVMNQNVVWVQDEGNDEGNKILSDDITCSPRIGIDYAEDDATLPWRFTLKRKELF